MLSVKFSEKSVQPEHNPTTKTLLKLQLSICMIVKNEASVLNQCLKSAVPCADEIIIVDTGSTDSTIEIAKKFGARITQSEWKDDFSFSRNCSLKEASCEWILWLDADDVVPDQSIRIINDLKKESADKVFGFIVRNQKPGNTGTEFIQARMFPNRPDIYFERRIHEQMMLSAMRIGLKLIDTGAVIEHHGYADPGAVRGKAKRNIPLLLLEYEETGPDPVMAIEIADSYSIIGETAFARAWYEKVLRLPESETSFPEIASQACLGLGNLCNTSTDYDSAIDYLGKALRLSPGRVDALYSLAVSFELNGRVPDAIDCLLKIVRAIPAPQKIGIDFREAKIKSFLRLGRLLMDSKKNIEALDLAQQALSQLPHRPEIHIMAGRIFFRNHKLMEALHAFEKSLEIEKANIDAYIGLCQIYLLAKKKETAIQTVKAIMPAFSDNPRFWALARQVQGDTSDIMAPPSVNGADVDKEEKKIRHDYAKP
jgi:glycosyltransferase involved in cell wall biosynthesis